MESGVLITLATSKVLILTLIGDDRDSVLIDDKWQQILFMPGVLLRLSSLFFENVIAVLTNPVPLSVPQTHVTSVHHDIGAVANKKKVSIRSHEACLPLTPCVRNYMFVRFLTLCCGPGVCWGHAGPSAGAVLGSDTLFIPRTIQGNKINIFTTTLMCFAAFSGYVWNLVIPTWSWMTEGLCWCNILCVMLFHLSFF